MPRKAILAQLRPGEQLLFAAIVLFIFVLAFQFLAAFLAAWIYGFGVSDLLYLKDYADPKYVAANKLIQIVASIGTFILPAFLISFLFEGRWFSYYKFNNKVDITALFLVALITISSIPLINYLAEINLGFSFPLESIDQLFRNLEGEAEKLMTAFTATGTFWGLMVNLLMIGVIAAIGEEIIFRGLLQTLFQKIIRNHHIAIVVTAILFSAFHFQFFSFLPRFLLGVVLGYLFYYGQSIWYPIAAHFVNNTMGVLYYYFASRDGSEDMLEEIGTSNMMQYMALISLVLTTFIFVLWYYQVRNFTSRSLPSGTAERE